MNDTILQIVNIQIGLQSANAKALKELQGITAKADCGYGESLDAYLLASIGPLVRSLSEKTSGEEYHILLQLTKERFVALVDSTRNVLEKVKKA